jgi:hypothetical protein
MVLASSITQVARTSGARTTTTVLVALVALAGAWATLMSMKLSTNATDVPLYFRYGEAIRHGNVPYRDFRVEYPPASLPSFALPGFAASGSRGFRIAFELLMGACAAGIVVATVCTLIRLREKVIPAVAFVGASTIALGPLTLGHYDLWPAFLVTAALSAFVWDRVAWSAVLLGLAVAAKVYGIVLFPILVASIWRRRGSRAALTWLGLCIGTVFVCYFPFVVASPGGVWWSITEQARRPLQLESSAAAALLGAHQFGMLQVGVTFSHSSVNLGGASASAAAVATVALEALALLLIWVVAARTAERPRQLLVACTAAVLAFVALGKVFSPQFLLWLIPFVPLLGGLLAISSSAALAVAIVVTRAYFPSRWGNLIHLELLPTCLLVARDVLLLGLLAALIHRLYAGAARRRPDDAHSA